MSSNRLSTDSKRVSTDLNRSSTSSNFVSIHAFMSSNRLPIQMLMAVKPTISTTISAANPIQSVVGTVMLLFVP